MPTLLLQRRIIHRGAAERAEIHYVQDQVSDFAPFMDSKLYGQRLPERFHEVLRALCDLQRMYSFAGGESEPLRPER